MKSWLEEYFEKYDVDENAFIEAFAELNADLKYVKQTLKFDTEELSAESLLKKINKNPQKRTFTNIAIALNRADVTPDSSSHDAQEIQRFHQSWQKHMRSNVPNYSQYKKKIVERLTLLSKDGFPLHQLTGLSSESDPVEAYASRLDKLLLSPDKNGPKLIGQIEQLLGIAERKHVECIVELATLVAFHFVPRALWESRLNKGMTIFRDDPAPALYRLIQNWRNDFVSQLYEYDGSDQKGAIPLKRTNLESNDFVMSIAERLDNKIDDHHLANAGADGYKINGKLHTELELATLDHKLRYESESADSRFVYAMEPEVLDKESVELLAKYLPSLNHYSHQPVKNDAIPDVIGLDSFLTTAREKIDICLQTFESDDDEVLKELSRLFEATLKESGHSANVPEPPKDVDRVKYLKWINEVLKTDKSVGEFIGRYPSLVDKVSAIASSVQQTSISHLQDLAKLI